MLENYEKGQPVGYRIFKNAIEKDKLSHAYLIETRGYPEGLDLALSFAKSLLCPHRYINFNLCDNCQQCRQIDEGNFTEIKVIEPDGMWIKKEQLSVLQTEFSKKPFIGTKKVYIIHGAEFLNSAAANSILKFLEEPEPNIIAILITENSNQVLNTIVSRCQTISLIPNLSNLVNKKSNIVEKIGTMLESSEAAFHDFVNGKDSLERIEKVIHFVEYYEKNGQDVLLYMQKLWFDTFSDKEKIYWAFQVMILFYKDILNCKENRQIDVFSDYQSQLIPLAQKNTIFDLCHKLNILLELRDKIAYNVNLNLLLDKLILDWSGGCTC